MRAPRKSVQEDFLEMQKAQLTSLQDLEKRQQDFLEEIIKEQQNERITLRKMRNGFLNSSYNE